MTKKEEYEQKIEEWRKAKAGLGTAENYRPGKEIKPTKFVHKNIEKAKKISKDLLENYEDLLNPTEKYEMKEFLSFF